MFLKEGEKNTGQDRSGTIILSGIDLNRDKSYRDPNIVTRIES